MPLSQYFTLRKYRRTSCTHGQVRILVPFRVPLHSVEQPVGASDLCDSYDNPTHEAADGGEEGSSAFIDESGAGERCIDNIHDFVW